MRIKRLYKKITWQELEALELLIKLFNEVEKTGLGISYEKIMVQSNKVNDKFENKIAELILLKKIISTLEENIKQADFNINYLNMFLEYVVMDKSIKQLEKEYDVKNIKDIIILFTQTIAIIINTLSR